MGERGSMLERENDDLEKSQGRERKKIESKKSERKRETAREERET